MSQRILIIEDEAAIRELVAVNLRHAGFLIQEAPDANAARSLIEREMPDLIVLDWMLPDMQGTELARELRSRPATKSVPILMLTARAQEGDKLLGFEVGVDDYVTKPFSPRELIARIKALMRRTPGAAQQSGQAPIELGGLRLEPETHRIFANQQAIELSPTEFKLLSYFMRKPERVHSRNKLLDDVWGNASNIEERTVDVHIRRLRLALRDSGLHTRIETVRSGGYRFNPG